MKRTAILAAAVLAAAFLFVLTLLPDRRVELPPAPWQTGANTVAGVLHIHTVRSDGSGTPDDVAAAAARAGLTFVVITDHGDATRPPDPPQYRSGVLCIDAVEISTAQGHYVALGLPQAPYPLGGEPRDVIADVDRLGGFGIVAHPDSAKPGLQWHDWTAPFPGLEWLNADSEWRDEATRPLLRALATYPFRPADTVGSLLDRPDTTLLRWDALTGRRRVVGTAGADAHARLGWRDDDTAQYRRGWFLRLPSYEASFRAFAVHVTLSRALSGDARADAALVLDAVRAGHLFTAVDTVAAPAAFAFTATNDHSAAGQGDVLEPGGPVRLLAKTNLPEGSGVLTLRKNGQVVAEHAGPQLSFDAPPETGVYRVEVALANAPGHPPVPWIVSNPIYVEPAGWGTPIAPLPADAIDSWGMQGGPWHAEQDARSNARVTVEEPPHGPVAFSYQLASGARAGQYAALVLAVGNALTGHARLAFRAHAAGPMRISVQARQPAGPRWQRSIYLDRTPRDVFVPFSELSPVNADAARLPFAPAQVDTVLFVVDTTNTAPGSAGTFTLSDVRVEH